MASGINTAKFAVTDQSNDNARQAPGAERNKTNIHLRPCCYPRRSCVKGKVLADLLNGKRITSANTWRRHGSSRLAHHILRLRQAGWPVVTTLISVETVDGRTALIGEYHLPAQTISMAGEAGRAYAANRRRAQ